MKVSTIKRISLLANISFFSSVLSVAGNPKLPEVQSSTTITTAYAEKLLDSMFSSDWRRMGLEGQPSQEGTANKLIALGEIGWNTTFKSLEAGRYHEAFISVLGKGISWGNQEARTKQLMSLLASKTCAHRREIPRIIMSREPLKGNQLLLPYITDSDPIVREYCVVALSPLVAQPTEIEAVIKLLDDANDSVRFQSRVFLQRATAHVTPLKPQSHEERAAWSAWWAAQQPADMSIIVKTGLTHCADLLTDRDKEFRECAAMPLIIHSGQVYYGFHQKNVWWGAQNGERSKAAWKEWLRLRYDVMASPNPTTWEDKCRIERPELHLASLRATIAMNVGDLESESSEVRSLARQNIQDLLKESSPFRMGSSDRENDWLNKGITIWWDNRIKDMGK